MRKRVKVGIYIKILSVMIDVVVPLRKECLNSNSKFTTTQMSSQQVVNEESD